MEELGDFFDGGAGSAAGAAGSGSAPGELVGASSHYMPYEDENPYASSTKHSASTA